jgi:hypothetical protein
LDTLVQAMKQLMKLFLMIKEKYSALKKKMDRLYLSLLIVKGMGLKYG